MSGASQLNKIVVYQDGGQFYNNETGVLLFTSSLYVKDFDIETAKLARNEFFIWADKQGLFPSGIKRWLPKEK